jgi:hypothetical protein
MVERCIERRTRRISYKNSSKRNIYRILVVLDFRNNAFCKFFLGIFSFKLGTSSRIGSNMATNRNKSSKSMGNTTIGK